MTKLTKTQIKINETIDTLIKDLNKKITQLSEEFCTEENAKELLYYISNRNNLKSSKFKEEEQTEGENNAN